MKQLINDKTLFKIDGKGKHPLTIIDTYFSLFNQGYNLTVEEICDYLSCTSTHFLNTYRNEISHIRINGAVRSMMTDFHSLGLVDITPFKHLILKRILYCRQDFDRFVLENLKAEYKYKKFSLQEVDIDLESLPIMKRIQLVEAVNLKLYEMYGVAVEPALKTIESIPEKLYSMKDLKTVLGCKYDMEIYRKIEAKGVNKYKLNNLVRYNIEDFNKSEIVVNYDTYMLLSETNMKKEIREIVKK